jgi:hypothetical protein
MRKTLAQAKNSTIPQAVGLATCDERFVQLLNEAQARLADMGKWWGTYKKLRVCVTAGCITWPREVKTIEAMNLCGYNIPIQNQWYEFQTDTRAPRTGCGREGCEQDQLLDRGMVTQFRDSVGNCYIRVTPQLSADVGKRVLLQGLDPNGIPIRTLDSVSGEYVWGEYVTLPNPSITAYVRTSNRFKQPGLTGAQKPLTQGSLTIIAENDTTGLLTQVAVWGPSEQNPEYRRTYLVGMPEVCGGTNSCSTTQDNCCIDNGDGCVPADEACTNTVVEAIVRLDFIPAIVDSDWLFIGNLQAIKHMMKAIQKEDRNQYTEAEREIQLALRSLRNELEAYSPNERSVINVQPFGSAKIQFRFGGFI